MRQSLRENLRTDLANDFAEQEIGQLGEDKECCREDIEPHGSNFLENGNYDVGHEPEIQESGPVQPICEQKNTRKGGITYAAGQTVVKTKRGMLFNAEGLDDG